MRKESHAKGCWCEVVVMGGIRECDGGGDGWWDEIIMGD